MVAQGFKLEFKQRGIFKINKIIKIIIFLFKNFCDVKLFIKLS